MSMGRILMTTDAVGGVWEYSLELAKGLAPLGWEVTLAILGPAPDAAQRSAAAAIAIVETGLPLDWLAQDAGEVRQAARAIAALATATGADVVHLNQPALAAEAMPVPVLAVVHSCVATWWTAVHGAAPMPPALAWQSALTAEGLNRAARIAAPSAAFADAVRSAYGLQERPHAVRNGRTAATAGPRPMHDFVLTAGRLWDEGKNVAVLDRAAAGLSVPVKAAGSVDAPSGGRVAFANLHLLGSLPHSQLAETLACRPIFVSTALYEPFGLAVLEAAQAGCALILADIPTFRELWDGAATFVPPRDSEALRRAIEEVIGDLALRVSRGNLAAARGGRLTGTAMVGDMAAIYARMHPPLRAGRAAA